ncbi:MULTISPECIES: fumarylacetoacetate hydrolase family protein [Arthrobacter]|uniref:Fumarylacetoacetate hydrolase family protein n=1 Tax=Arthrobacter methylotrophus TaxID=121291 RepID=A0ABV5UKF4_9MICC|nr:fumarylacetoacetate hydrolase family protein [Arthrobacter sp. MA-N2]
MAYANYTYQGRNFLGEVDGDKVVPLKGLSSINADTTPEVLEAAERLIDQAVAVTDVTLRAASPEAGKIVCVGLNYKSHIEETNRELPTYPVMFPKYASNLIGPKDDIQLPPEASQVDYEAELAVIVGRGGRRISEVDALDHVLGYATSNDVTMRDYQYKTHQWMQGKAWDNSTPIGPYVITPGEVDLSTAAIQTVLNGEVVQSSDLSFLIFSVAKLIATVSEFTELAPGDVILTGTPAGVGYRRDPQLFLKDGDTVSVSIEGVGTVSNKVVAEVL